MFHYGLADSSFHVVQIKECISCSCFKRNCNETGHKPVYDACIDALLCAKAYMKVGNDTCNNKLVDLIKKYYGHLETALGPSAPEFLEVIEFMKRLNDSERCANPLCVAINTTLPAKKCSKCSSVKYCSR